MNFCHRYMFYVDVFDILIREMFVMIVLILISIFFDFIKQIERFQYNLLEIIIIILKQTPKNIYNLPYS